MELKSATTLLGTRKHTLDIEQIFIRFRVEARMSECLFDEGFVYF